MQKKKLAVKGIALATVFVFLLTNTGMAQGPLAVSEIASANLGTANIFPARISIPEEFGTVQGEFRAGGESPFIVFIQDAHAVVDAQVNIQNLIRHFGETYGVGLVAIEGGKGRLDPTILRTFPDEKIRKNVLGEYLARGEMTGAESAAAMNAGEAAYFGIEDWPLYEAHYLAYLRAMKNQEALQAVIQSREAEFDKERAAAYSAEHNEFHEKVMAFRRDKIELLDFLKYLKDGGDADASVYPQLAILMDSIVKDASFNRAALDGEIRELGDGLRKKYATRLPRKKMLELNGKYQELVTARIDAASFLKYLVDVAQSQGEKLKLTPGMRQLLGHEETLAGIKGSNLFDELEAFLAEREAQCSAGAEEKMLSEKYRKLLVLEDLAKLELTREKLEKYQASAKEYLALLPDAKLAAPNLEFYRCALIRDEVLQKNLEALMNREKKKASIVVLGGFHRQGFEKRLREKNISYCTIMPRIQGLGGAENYDTVMQGKLSYKEYLTTSFYDAFMKASSLKFVAGLNEPDFRRYAKEWRDGILRRLAAEGRIAQAGNYTRYVDLLIKVYVEKFGTQALAGRRKEDVLKDIEKELNNYRDDYLKRKWTTLESRLKVFAGGLKSLIGSKQVTPQAVQALVNETAKAKPSSLQAIRAILGPDYTVADVAPFIRDAMGNLGIEAMPDVAAPLYENVAADVVVESVRLALNKMAPADEPVEVSPEVMKQVKGSFEDYVSTNDQLRRNVTGDVRAQGKLSPGTTQALIDRSKGFLTNMGMSDQKAIQVIKQVLNEGSQEEAKAVQSIAGPSAAVKMRPGGVFEVTTAKAPSATVPAILGPDGKPLKVETADAPAGQALGEIEENYDLLDSSRVDLDEISFDFGRGPLVSVYQILPLEPLLGGNIRKQMPLGTVQRGLDDGWLRAYRHKAGSVIIKDCLDEVMLPDGENIMVDNFLPRRQTDARKWERVNIKTVREKLREENGEFKTGRIEGGLVVFRNPGFRGEASVEIRDAEAIDADQLINGALNKIREFLNRESIASVTEEEIAEVRRNLYEAAKVRPDSSRIKLARGILEFIEAVNSGDADSVNAKLGEVEKDFEHVNWDAKDDLLNKMDLLAEEARSEAANRKGEVVRELSREEALQFLGEQIRDRKDVRVFRWIPKYTDAIYAKACEPDSVRDALKNGSVKVVDVPWLGRVFVGNAEELGRAEDAALKTEPREEAEGEKDLIRRKTSDYSTEYSPYWRYSSVLVEMVHELDAREERGESIHEQGWKFHVAMLEEDSDEVKGRILEAVCGMLNGLDIPHKVINGAEKYAEALTGTQRGKGITVYLREKDAENLDRRLGDGLSKIAQQSGVNLMDVAGAFLGMLLDDTMAGIPKPADFRWGLSGEGGDKRLRGTASRSERVGYRYGSFTDDWVELPDGKFVKDDRYEYKPKDLTITFSHSGVSGSLEELLGEPGVVDRLTGLGDTALSLGQGAAEGQSLGKKKQDLTPAEERTITDFTALKLAHIIDRQYEGKPFSSEENARRTLEQYLELYDLSPADILEVRSFLRVTGKEKFWLGLNELGQKKGAEIGKRIGTPDSQFVLDREAFETARRITENLEGYIAAGNGFSAYTDSLAEAIGKLQEELQRMGIRDADFRARVLKFIRYSEQRVGFFNVENRIVLENPVLFSSERADEREKASLAGNPFYELLISQYRSDDETKTTDTALRIVRALKRSGIDIDDARIVQLFREPEVSLRYREFGEFYRTLANPESFDTDELRRKFIEFLGEATVYRSVALSEEELRDIDELGMLSPFLKRNGVTPEDVNRLTEKYGIESVMSDSVFRLSTGSIPETSRGEGEGRDRTHLSLTKYWPYGLAIVRDYARDYIESLDRLISEIPRGLPGEREPLSAEQQERFESLLRRIWTLDEKEVREAIKKENLTAETLPLFRQFVSDKAESYRARKIYTFEIRVPRFYVTEYDGSSLIKLTNGWTPGTEVSADSFRDPDTGEVMSVPSVDGGIELLSPEIRRQWIMARWEHPVYRDIAEYDKETPYWTSDSSRGNPAPEVIEPETREVIDMSKSGPTIDRARREKGTSVIGKTERQATPKEAFSAKDARDLAKQLAGQRGDFDHYGPRSSAELRESISLREKPAEFVDLVMRHLEIVSGSEGKLPGTALRFDSTGSQPTGRKEIKEGKSLGTKTVAKAEPALEVEAPARDPRLERVGEYLTAPGGRKLSKADAQFFFEQVLLAAKELSRSTDWLSAGGAVDFSESEFMHNRGDLFELLKARQFFSSDAAPGKYFLALCGKMFGEDFLREREPRDVIKEETDAMMAGKAEQLFEELLKKRTGASFLKLPQVKLAVFSAASEMNLTALSLISPFIVGVLFAMIYPPLEEYLRSQSAVNWLTFGLIGTLIRVLMEGVKEIAEYYVGRALYPQLSKYEVGTTLVEKLYRQGIYEWMMDIRPEDYRKDRAEYRKRSKELRERITPRLQPKEGLSVRAQLKVLELAEEMVLEASGARRWNPRRGEESVRKFLQILKNAEDLAAREIDAGGVSAEAVALSMIETVANDREKPEAFWKIWEARFNKAKEGSQRPGDQALRVMRALAFFSVVFARGRFRSWVLSGKGEESEALIKGLLERSGGDPVAGDFEIAKFVASGEDAENLLTHLGDDQRKSHQEQFMTSLLWYTGDAAKNNNVPADLKVRDILQAYFYRDLFRLENLFEEARSREGAKTEEGYPERVFRTSRRWMDYFGELREKDEWDLQRYGMSSEQLGNWIRMVKGARKAYILRDAEAEGAVAPAKDEALLAAIDFVEDEIRKASKPEDADTWEEEFLLDWRAMVRSPGESGTKASSLGSEAILPFTLRPLTETESARVDDLMRGVRDGNVEELAQKIPALEAALNALPPKSRAVLQDCIIGFDAEIKTPVNIDLESKKVMIHPALFIVGEPGEVQLLFQSILLPHVAYRFKSIIDDRLAIGVALALDWGRMKGLSESEQEQVARYLRNIGQEGGRAYSDFMEAGKLDLAMIKILSGNPEISNPQVLTEVNLVRKREMEEAGILNRVALGLLNIEMPDEKDRIRSLNDLLGSGAGVSRRAVVDVILPFSGTEEAVEDSEEEISSRTKAWFQGMIEDETIAEFLQSKTGLDVEVARKNLYELLRLMDTAFEKFDSPQMQNIFQIINDSENPTINYLPDDFLNLLTMAEQIEDLWKIGNGAIYAMISFMEAAQARIRLEEKGWPALMDLYRDLKNNPKPFYERVNQIAGQCIEVVKELNPLSSEEARERLDRFAERILLGAREGESFDALMIYFAQAIFLGRMGYDVTRDPNLRIAIPTDAGRWLYYLLAMGHLCRIAKARLDEIMGQYGTVNNTLPFCSFAGSYYAASSVVKEFLSEDENEKAYMEKLTFGAFTTTLEEWRGILGESLQFFIGTNFGRMLLSARIDEAAKTIRMNGQEYSLAANPELLDNILYAMGPVRQKIKEIAAWSTEEIAEELGIEVGKISGEFLRELKDVADRLEAGEEALPPVPEDLPVLAEPSNPIGGGEDREIRIQKFAILDRLVMNGMRFLVPMFVNVIEQLVMNDWKAANGRLEISPADWKQQRGEIAKTAPISQARYYNAVAPGYLMGLAYLQISRTYQNSDLSEGENEAIRAYAYEQAVKKFSDIDALIKEGSLPGDGVSVAVRQVFVRAMGGIQQAVRSPGEKPVDLLNLWAALHETINEIKEGKRGNVSLTPWDILIRNPTFGEGTSADEESRRAHRAIYEAICDSSETGLNDLEALTFLLNSLETVLGKEEGESTEDGGPMQNPPSAQALGQGTKTREPEHDDLQSETQGMEKDEINAIVDKAVEAWKETAKQESEKKKTDLDVGIKALTDKLKTLSSPEDIFTQFPALAEEAFKDILPSEEIAALDLVVRSMLIVGLVDKATEKAMRGDEGMTLKSLEALRQICAGTPEEIRTQMNLGLGRLLDSSNPNDQKLCAEWSKLGRDAFSGVNPDIYSTKEIFLDYDVLKKALSFNPDDSRDVLVSLAKASRLTIPYAKRDAKGAMDLIRSLSLAAAVIGYPLTDRKTPKDALRFLGGAAKAITNEKAIVGANAMRAEPDEIAAAELDLRTLLTLASFVRTLYNIPDSMRDANGYIQVDQKIIGLFARIAELAEEAIAEERVRQAA